MGDETTAPANRDFGGVNCLIGWIERQKVPYDLGVTADTG